MIFKNLLFLVHFLMRVLNHIFRRWNIFINLFTHIYTWRFTIPTHTPLTVCMVENFFYSTARIHRHRVLYCSPYILSIYNSIPLPRLVWITNFTTVTARADNSAQCSKWSVVSGIIIILHLYVYMMCTLCTIYVQMLPYVHRKYGICIIIMHTCWRFSFVRALIFRFVFDQTTACTNVPPIRVIFQCPNKHWCKVPIV